MIILVIALVVMGPQKLPEIASSLGKGIAQFKRASNDFRNSIEQEARVAEEKERLAKEEQLAAQQAAEQGKAQADGSAAGAGAASA
ncbi:twin-arginine translocase TatA/TatE family subunit [Geomonas sp. RF6]|uniref:twin-arginine translocase TatA/TatE family subunit n=1 Tax=Geomonas sp. RF6 TaxID=2897342 RepID=UPI003FA5F16F